MKVAYRTFGYFTSASCFCNFLHANSKQKRRPVLVPDGVRVTHLVGGMTWESLELEKPFKALSSIRSVTKKSSLGPLSNTVNPLTFKTLSLSWNDYGYEITPVTKLPRWFQTSKPFGNDVSVIYPQVVRGVLDDLH
jgi:hypothetical protein